MTTEKKWIKLIQKRSDENAANKLIGYYYHSIYSYVYKQTMDKQLSMDVTQEIFISMLQTIHHFNDKKASFKTWLYRIATYKVVDYFRSKHYTYDQSTDTMEFVELGTTSDFTIELEYKEDVRKVTEIINAFQVKDQQILRLKLFAEHTFSEIAATLDVPESSIKTKYYSAIKKIKQRMEAE
ncbi:RNA polymerase sigma factor [Fictibacillus nanhaiensis]|uniref:RNA polymerase sigma factor n=1 Tax=Fictibacillus nanhaiensis TaxID=742169 RepID=UPI001C95B6D1|nr:RNA polymerase sigma factor [Fictibacillus nanhaiensis]MBY6037274.1 RNA polymerase sigma factor [Fictibacillus nanhaiensis]